jgi:hypothetical protein
MKSDGESRSLVQQGDAQLESSKAQATIDTGRCTKPLRGSSLI